MTEPIIGAKNLRKQLDEFEQGLGKQLIRDAKDAVEPARSRVQAAIGNVVPLSGMRGNGRLSWFRAANQKVVSAWDTKRSKYRAVTPLVKIKVMGAAAAMVDTAGKGNSTKTRQGAVMVSRLRERRRSNFAWPAVEAMKPSVEAKVRMVVDKYCDLVNRKI